MSLVGTQSSKHKVPSTKLKAPKFKGKAIPSSLLQLPSEHLRAIIGHAEETAPEECCGIIGGTDQWLAQSVYRLRNVTPHPVLAYEAAPEELFVAQRQMRERGENLLAIYHSHPRADEPSPSQTDVEQAYYPSAVYLIVGLGGTQPVVKAFRISEGEQRWQQVEYVIVGG